MNMNQYTFDENLLSDLHKDAYGVRPSGSFYLMWNEASDQRRQEIWDRLLESLDHAMTEQEESYAHAITVTEAHIRTTMYTCGCTRRDAVRHLCDAYDCDGDIEHLEYMTRVPYGYFTKEFGRWFVKENVNV